MLQELDHAHLLTRQLVPDGGAGGVTVRPRAAVDQMQRAASHRRRLVLLVVVVAVATVDGGIVVDVLEAAVPAVKGSGEGCAFNLNVHPVAAVR